MASDALFGDNSINRKSFQAFVIKLFGGLIGRKTNKQDTVITSIIKAEFLAFAQAAKETLFVSRLLYKLIIKLDDYAVHIKCNNKQTIKFVNAELALLKTKLRHVDIHNYWLRQKVQRGTIIVNYTPFAQMMADGLTKPLSAAKWPAFLDQIGLIDSWNLKIKEIVMPKSILQDRLNSSD
jgi:hypothetical protein